MNLRLVSAKGGPIRLGRELGRGGEGAVLELADTSDFVAKIYHSPPDPNKADKLIAMANGCTTRLRDISAWPVDIIRDTPSGPVRGFVMRRVARQKDIHLLYGPKTRLRDYPDANYRFLVHVATNLARAFAVIHEHGHVIGDVNQGGVCVSERATVTLVDCDSFQVHCAQRVFGCDVGIPIYQPPEFQSVRSFQGLPRTSNHDVFGLAILIFQTLFLARHPFAGAFQGEGDMPIERAIREFRFAYARDATRRQMKQPPGSLGLGSVPASLAELFERAFLELGTRERPSARDWMTALDGFSSDLRDCPQNKAHAYTATLSRCPLCEMEGRIGVLLFLPPRQGGLASVGIDVEEFWRKLTPIVASTRVPPFSLSVPSLPPPDAILRFKVARSTAWKVLAGGIALTVLLAMTLHPAVLAGALAFPFVALAIRGPVPDESRNVRKRLADAQERLGSVHRQLERERSTSPLPGLEARAESLYRSLKEFPHRRNERLRKLEQSRYERQLRRFLDRFEVKDCRLKGFGAGLCAALVSNAVETADDLTPDKLQGIPGFGAKRIAALLEWRRSLEAKFKFTDVDPTDAQERVRVKRELQIENAKDVAEFRRLGEQIKAHAGPLQIRMTTLTTELGRAQQDLATAHATAVALGEAA